MGCGEFGQRSGWCERGDDSLQARVLLRRRSDRGAADVHEWEGWDRAPHAPWWSASSIETAGRSEVGTGRGQRLRGRRVSRDRASMASVVGSGTA